MASIAPFYQKSVDEVSVLIIGAGISGLSAAHQLKSHGFKDVVILEARSRIGGRIETSNYGANAIEMGAQWIHGQEGNAIYDLAQLNSLVEGNNSPDLLFSWSNITCKEKKAVILETVKFLEKSICELQEKVPKYELSLLDYLQSCFNRYLSDDKGSCLKELKYSVFQWYIKYQCEVNGCSNLDLVSARLIHRYRECKGEPLVELKYGYSSVLNIILSSLPSDWILKNKEVCKVILNYDKEKGDCNISEPVEVICCDGSIYRGDHVIITIPLGCLKNAITSMFNPPLPQRKRDAVMFMGFDVLNKVYLKYEEPFWDHDFVLNMLWDRDRYSIDSSTNEESEGLQPWYKCINRFSCVPHQPNLLCAWVAGIGGILMEKLSLDQVVSDCHKILEMKLQKESLPLPVDALRSAWKTDEFSKGSYSYLTVECGKYGVNNLDLAQPIFILKESRQHPALLFAGEATHPYYYSTVHGAFETGIREADRIHYHYREEALPPDSLTTMTNVVIIGAGVSGLACAQRLTAAGINDVHILEAHNRIGGRINTVKCEKSVLELGAQWIHGEEGNLFYEFCKMRKLLLNPSESHIPSEAKGLFCTSDGEIVPEEIVDEVMLKMQGIKESVQSMPHNGMYPGSPMNEVFSSGFEEYMSTCCDTPKIKAWKKGIFDWFLKFEIIDNACDNLCDIPASGYASWIECPGHFYNSLKNGFSSFLESLVSEIPVSSLVLSKPVKCIHWKNDYENIHRKYSGFPVLIECCDGDWFAAKHVVVTSSVGFIQKNLDFFFHPLLPESKINAFQTTGFGTINKIFLLFPRCFWKDEEIGFQLIWLDDSSLQEKFALPEISWVHGISGFDQVFNQPNVLVSWIGGPHAKEVEKISDDVVGKVCASLLRTFMPDRNIPDPVEIIRSNWFSDDYIKGSYSSRTKNFYETGCTVKDLNKPLSFLYTTQSGENLQWPVVTFAGEAMDEEYFASVHGALRSGWLEADRIIDFSRIMNKSSSADSSSCKE